MTAAAELQRALEPRVAALGVDLDGVEFQQAGRRTLVRVIIDRDGGIDLDAVAQVSAVVSEALDGSDLAALIPGSFVLEVTSPGVDRPLTQERHWRRAIGRLVDITLDDSSTVCGRLQQVNGHESVDLDISDSLTQIPLDRVRRAVVQVEFGPVE